MDTVKDFGAIYCANGAYYQEQANISAYFLKKYNDINTTVFTNSAEKIKKELFDNVFYIPRESQYARFDKLYSIKNTPYNKTVYLDCDTVVIRNIEHVFIGLERFDLLVCHAPVRINKKCVLAKDPAYWFFSQINGGVLFYKNSERVTDQFINAWLNDYKKNYPCIKRDQESLQRILYESELDFYILPPEYNFRAEFLNQAKGINFPVFIIHSHKAVGKGAKYIEKKLIPRLIVDEGFVWSMDRGFKKLRRKVFRKVTAK